MYNLWVVRARVHVPCLLFALVVAAFISLYPQLNAAGYCGNGGCPEVSYPAHGAGSASGGAIVAGVSFVVATLVAVQGVLAARVVGSVLRVPSHDIILGIVLSPETPPPRLSA